MKAAQSVVRSKVMVARFVTRVDFPGLARCALRSVLQSARVIIRFLKKTLFGIMENDRRPFRVSNCCDGRRKSEQKISEGLVSL
jgi:hypothetical protein